MTGTGAADRRVRAADGAMSGLLERFGLGTGLGGALRKRKAIASPSRAGSSSSEEHDEARPLLATEPESRIAADRVTRLQALPTAYRADGNGESFSHQVETGLDRAALYGLLDRRLEQNPSLQALTGDEIPQRIRLAEDRLPDGRPDPAYPLKYRAVVDDGRPDGRLGGVMYVPTKYPGRYEILLRDIAAPPERRPMRATEFEATWDEIQRELERCAPQLTLVPPIDLPE